MDRKSHASPLELKGEGTGQFRATIATLNVLDKDGDVTLPGAFKSGQQVKIAAWNHNWNVLPVGTGTLGADTDKAWVDGEFFLDTEAGREHYLTVKRLGGLQEWSYGYDVLKRSFGQFEGAEATFLEDLFVHEASPVMIGAGVGTGTDSIKASKAEPEDAKPYGIRREGEQFCVYNTETGATEKCHPTRDEALAHQRALMANVEDAGKSFTARLAKALLDVDALVALAGTAGLLDDPANRTALTEVLVKLDQSHRAFDRLLKATDQSAELDPRNLLARFQALQARYGLTTAGRE